MSSRRNGPPRIGFGSAVSTKLAYYSVLEDGDHSDSIQQSS